MAELSAMKHGTSLTILIFIYIANAGTVAYTTGSLSKPQSKPQSHQSTPSLYSDWGLESDCCMCLCHGLEVNAPGTRKSWRVVNSFKTRFSKRWDSSTDNLRDIEPPTSTVNS
eukprot:1056364-Rhodomonas_salina.2